MLVELLADDCGVDAVQDVAANVHPAKLVAVPLRNTVTPFSFALGQHKVPGLRFGRKVTSAGAPSTIRMGFDNFVGLNKKGC